jgi:methylenetetrahydrofolate reductase (NADPH)
MTSFNEASRPSAAIGSHLARLFKNLTFEVVPLKSLDAAVAALPPSSQVSVTCSPVKGIAETMAITDKIRAAGHIAIPHIAARMVRDQAHVAEIAAWLRTEQIGRLFLVGGDADQPGAYPDALSFLRDLLDADPGLHTVGVAGYPDGHSFIDGSVLSGALRAKQDVLAEAGVNGYASTQMCFNPDRIRSWVAAERVLGFTLPIHLGVAGVIDRTKLMTMGVRLGIGPSLGYLKKNRRALGRLLVSPTYNPNSLLDPLADHLDALNVQGIHCFTFNQVEATEAWRRKTLASHRR